jgi:hypothetical protein
MEERQLKELKDHVAEVIRLTVNGKIDKLTHEFADWKETEGMKRNAIELKLDEYIETTLPMVDFFQSTTGFRKVSKWIFGFLVAIAGAYLLAKEILR